jgi:NADH dehydrogenase
MLNTRVLDITDKALTLQANGQETTLPTWTIIWAAGIQASPLGKLLVAGAGGGVTVDRMGRVPVNPECQLAGFPEVFVIGDMAMCLGRDGKPVPGVAPAAVQQGQYVSKRLSRQLAGKSLPGPFRYWDKGSMATIGRSRAVAESAGFKISGWFAWLAWLLIHIVYLARFENRVLVMFQWFWNYITRNRTARLITGNNVEIKS